MTPKVSPIRTLTPDQIADIDRYGELDRRKQLAEPDADEMATIKTRLQKLQEDTPADECPSMSGNVYRVQMSSKRKERTFSDKRKAFHALKKALGLDGLIAVLDLPLGVIDKNVAESKRKVFLLEELSGYRTLNVVALAPAAARWQPRSV